MRPVPVAQVKRNQITNAGLAPLVDLLNLRSLDLHGTRVTDRGLEDHVSQMVRLQGLSLAYLCVTNAGLESLDAVNWLERLNLKSTSLTSEGIVRVATDRAHTLRRLNVSKTVLDDDGLARFPEDSHLQKLSLEDTAITDVGLTKMPKPQWLSEFNLAMTDVTDDGIRSLVDCAQLSCLRLSGSKITDTSFVWLSDLRLERLEVASTKVSDAGMPALADFESLRTVDLRSTPLTNRGVRFLAEHGAVEQLSLLYTQVGPGLFESLEALPLRWLAVSGAFDKSDLRTLGQFRQLRHLAILQCVADTWSPLDQLTDLEVLLVDDQVRDVSALESLHGLKHLILWGDAFPAAQVARLRLSLSDCHIHEVPLSKSPMYLFKRLTV